MSRTFRPRQRAEISVVDVETGEVTVVHTAKQILVEAPNWSRDGAWLVVNGDGRLFRVAVDGSTGLQEIPMPGLPTIDTDHVLSPDGATVYVSAADGHIYAVPFEGGEGRRVTNDHGPRFAHYVHGVSPDGATLSYIGAKTKKDGRVRTDVFTIPSAGGEDIRITDDQIPDDGAEMGPDGEWIYFSSERAARKPGQSQLFRIALDRIVCEQLTDDKRVNWFPHPSPDGKRVAYVSYPKGTKSNKADVEGVVVRVLEPDGAIRDLATVTGGQGTMNVPSWSPDGARFAFIAYPIEEKKAR